MKKILIVMLIAFSITTYGQYKETGLSGSSVYDGIVNTQSNSLFGFINPDNLKMQNTYEMSYSTFSGQSLALGAFTNSLFYKLSNKFDVQLSTSIVMSPYSSIGSDFQKSINGVYITNAQLNYRPWKNVEVVLQYRQIPAGSYYYSPFSYYGYGRTGFLNEFGFSNWNNSTEENK